MNIPDQQSYWRSSLKITLSILFVWAFVSLGCGVVFRKLLDAFHVGGAPLGFWMAQQGAVLAFIALLVAYQFSMNRLDRAHGFDEEDPS